MRVWGWVLMYTTFAFLVSTAMVSGGESPAAPAPAPPLPPAAAPAEAAPVPSTTAAVAPAPDVTKDLEALRKDNEELKARVKALEDAKAGAPAAGGGAPTTPPGVIPIGKDLFLKFRSDVRLRYEKLFNAFDLENDVNDNWYSTRLRTRLGFDFDYKDTVGAYIQLMNEYRWGSETKSQTLVPNYQEYQAEDVRIDNAYLRIKHPWNVPFVFTGGRQDLLADPEKGWRGMYGEGWLLFDGTPEDGSASISFDSLKLRFDGIRDTTIDAIYAQTAHINFGTVPGTNAKTLGNTWADSDYDEDLYTLYGITRLIPKIQLDGYVMARDKNPDLNYAGTGKNFWDPHLDTEVFGGKVGSSTSYWKHFDWAIQGAYETGHVRPAGTGFIGETPYSLGENVRRDAYGYYAWGKVNFNEELPRVNPWVSARWDHLSGDDPNTKDRFEGWDPMFADWPLYSELLIYTVYDPFMPAHGTADPDLGSWTNMKFPTIEAGLVPDFLGLNKKLSIKGGWRHFLADMPHQPTTNQFTGAPASFTRGPTRGDLWQVYAEYAPVPFLRTHVYFDYFTVGDFYGPSADNAWFFRVEAMFILF
jgi:hypothetical protein